jgi:hypothetical protein
MNLTRSMHVNPNPQLSSAHSLTSQAAFSASVLDSS